MQAVALGAAAGLVFTQLSGYRRNRSPTQPGEDTMELLLLLILLALITPKRRRR